MRKFKLLIVMSALLFVVGCGQGALGNEPLDVEVESTFLSSNELQVSFWFENATSFEITLKSVILSYSCEENMVERNILPLAHFQTLGTKSHDLVFDLENFEFPEGVLTVTFNWDGEEQVITHEVVNQFFN